MKIACLGWGSLIWRPENLLILREWFSDGPFLQVEFARQSKDGRLTLVITNKAKYVRTLWALMSTEDLNIAKKSLQLRESIPDKKAETLIGSIGINEETTDPVKTIIKNWAINLKLDAVIWTNLPPKYEGIDGRSPTIDEAVLYIKTLDINKRGFAEEYVRRAPKQIDSDFRRKFEIEFGWTYLE